MPGEQDKAALEGNLQRLHAENVERLGRQDKVLAKIVDILQGKDPLGNPGEGLVSDVKWLKRREQLREEQAVKAESERQAQYRKLKGVLWTAIAGWVGAAGMALWHWLTGDGGPTNR